MREKKLLVFAVSLGVLVLLSSVLFFALFPTALATGDGAVGGIATQALTQALRHGKWPTQAAAHMGGIHPNRHGPQRNDPAESIPKHAYSPFDERSNWDNPCHQGELLQTGLEGSLL